MTRSLFRLAPDFRQCFFILGASSLLSLSACSSSSDKNENIPINSNSNGKDESGDDDGDSTPDDSDTNPTKGQDESQSTSEGPPSGSSDGDSTETGVLTCADIVCEGHGSCVEDEEHGAQCVCDTFYVLNEAGDTCIVDEGCIKVTRLEEDCRQRINHAPAVGLFFAVDFCAGTAVTPDKFSSLGLDFIVLENEVDISENVESASMVLDKDVESFVTLVLDVSDSVTGDENLGTLVQALRDFVSKLKPAQGAPKVFIEVFVFGRIVEPYVTLTEDFAQVDAALAEIQSNPSGVTSEGNGGGTSLYDATIKGIEHVQRNRFLRSAVTRGGVLSTGTVVIVTDGKDTSGGKLATSTVNDTLNQVISVGISEDIDDEDLTRIGKDGSFLAPTPESWATAFDEIADRVKEYPDRSYFLAYCSSTTQGEPEVTVSLSGITPQETATCKFDADYFASNPPIACDVDTFADECETRVCGGMTGCGACDDDRCCNNFGQCVAPTNAADCDGEDSLCRSSGQICQDGATNNDPDVCADPPAVSEVCADGNKCSPGVSWCDTDSDPKICKDAKSEGAQCEHFSECETQHCDQHNPDNALDPEICLPPAEIYDACSGGKAQCESGAFCQTDCKPKKKLTESCNKNGECESGSCDDEFNVCQGTGVCYWTWDEKVGSND